MNDTTDQKRFERLVDGELPEAEYRALLASLDDEPGGWRRCALAFLESQALASEMGGVRHSLDLRDTAAGKPPTSRQDPSWWNEWATLLAIAASFLLAFCLGIVAPRFFPLGRQEIGPTGNLNMSGTIAANETGDGSRHQTLRPIGNVRLVMDGPAGENSDAEVVPVYEVGPDLENYLTGSAPVLGTELIELLRQQGYDVQHQQQFFPAPLDDGRQLIVPLDGYQITPVSRRY